MTDYKGPGQGWWGPPKKPPAEVSSSSTCNLPSWEDTRLREQLEAYNHDLARFLVTEPLEAIAVAHCWYCGTRITVVMDGEPCPGCAATDWDRKD